MADIFEPISIDTNTIESLDTRPSISADELKKKFDLDVTTLKNSVNSFIETLNNAIEAISGDASAENKTLVTKKVVSEMLTGGVSIGNASTLEGKTILDLFPIGSIHLTANNVNPSTYLGGTWARIGGGMVPVGVNESDDDFAANMTGGEKTHTLTVSEMPSHDHPGVTLDGTKLGLNRDNTGVNGWGTSLTTRNVYGEFIAGKKGGGAAHNNMPPYFTCYIWRRTA